jgi:hypothetical protein
VSRPSPRHPILLQAVRRKIVPKDPLVGIVGGELDWREFPSIVGSEHSWLVTALFLYRGLDMLDDIGCQEHHPHVSSGAVDEDEATPATGCRHRDWTTEVIVHQLQGLAHVVVAMLGERIMTVLGEDAGVVELLSVVDL